MTVEAASLPVKAPLMAVEVANMPVEAMDHLELLCSRWSIASTGREAASIVVKAAAIGTQMLR